MKKRESVRRVDRESLSLFDEETKKMLDCVYGVDKHPAVNTPAKRLAWRFGYENPLARLGRSRRLTTEEKRKGDELTHLLGGFDPIRLGEKNTDITEDKLDAFYIALGKTAAEYGKNKRCYILKEPKKGR